MGIAGCSGAGKGYLVDLLVESVPSGSVAVLHADAYYNDQADVPIKERELVNYDVPAAIEHALLVQHMDALVGGQSVEQPVYDFANHTRTAKTQQVAAAPVIVVEGLFVLVEEAIRKRLDLAVFVDAPLNLCFARRSERDARERGRSPGSVAAQCKDSVKAAAIDLIQPSRQRADLIVPNGQLARLDRPVAVLAAYVAALAGSESPRR